MSEPKNELYLVVPELVEQPTWGGAYIAQFKGIDGDPLLCDQRLGQSYELSGTSRLMPVSSCNTLLDRAGYERTITLPKLYHVQGVASTDRIAELSMADLIAREGERFLGRMVYERYGAVMPLLIKFTQALGNSFQLHVKEEAEEEDGWLAKPESWYFLEPGLVTLGIRPGADVEEYHRVCEAIEELMQELSDQIRSGAVSLEAGRERATAAVQELDPWQFVNRFPVQSGTVIDPSAGGIHHSWEEDSEICPLGNIVYEVQLDRPDERSTMRSFDKGKIRDDGTIRAVQVTDYFTHLDSSPAANDLSILVREPERVPSSTGQADLLFATRQYACRRIRLSAADSMHRDETADSFHHLFVSQGEVEVSCNGIAYVLGQGQAVIIPANFGVYFLGAVAGCEAEVLETRVE
ncbi:MAG TPA: hypothetical protein PKL83_00940 [bacterium]|nr:hypothetical protein [bacterium]